MIDQRTHAEVVACTVDLASAAVPDHEGEVANQPLNPRMPPPFVNSDCDSEIGIHRPLAAPQRGSQLVPVVEAEISDGAQPPSIVAKRLENELLS
jgi:hypothetical protein